MSNVTLDLDCAHVEIDTNGPLAIVQVREGAEVDARMAEKVHRAIKAHCPGRYAVLADRRHAYSLTYDGIDYIRSNADRIAYAVVVHRRQSELSAEFQLRVDPEMRLFTDREQAERFLRNALAGFS